MHIFAILKRPVITEKATDMQDQGKYTFEVAPQATKLQIKEAVEKAFDVRVVKVNTMNVHGKTKRLGARVFKTSGWKKAIVTLKQGDRIDVFEGV